MVKRVRTLEVLGMGAEPIWNGEFSKIKLIDALNWYNYCYDQKKAKEFLIDYCKEMKLVADLRKVKSIPESKVILQVGWLARMMIIGMIPDTSTQKYFDENYAKILSIKMANTAPVVKLVAPMASIQDRIRDKARDEAGEIEGIIDDFVSSDFKQKYDFEKYFRSKSLSAVVLTKICEMFVVSSKEISDAVVGDDEQLVEAYSHIKRPHLKKLNEFYGMIVSASNKIAIESIPVKRKRKIKDKPVTQIVSKVKYLEECDELKLKSLPIENVVGSSQVWTYNVKTKLLSVYNTDNAKGLTFKGTTIKNFDDKMSTGKRLRKPEVVIAQLMDAGKIKLKKILPDLKTKEQVLTGRFNCDTIVLKILK